MTMKWMAEIPRVDRRRAKSIERSRGALLRKLSDSAVSCCNGSKFYVSGLSPGCRACAQGKWSCLFLTGRCFAGCFFCPQDRRAAARRYAFEMDGLRVAGPDEYVRFLTRTGRTGCGFSGGECTIPFRKLLSYIRACRTAMGSGFYIWIYTNGSRIDRSKLRQLARAGLDEIRFNICADGYSLEKPALAAAFIKNVTVEIPAVPEDEKKVARLLPGMREAGVKFLNLHQLVATPFNYRQLRSRGYTFLRQPHVTVAESELCALRLLITATASGGPAPAVNYCSAIYKHRYQQFCLRSRALPLAAGPGERVTAAGFIRSQRDGLFQYSEARLRRRPTARGSAVFEARQCVVSGLLRPDARADRASFEHIAPGLGEIV